MAVGLRRSMVGNGERGAVRKKLPAVGRELKTGGWESGLALMLEGVL